MNYCQRVIKDLMNCDDDHIGENRINEAREELKAFLNCDDYELNRFIEFFVEVTNTIEIHVKGE